jgi:hypothetical protein
MKNGIAIFMIESPLRRIFQKNSIVSMLRNECGWGNGYVLLPTNHPFYGVDYDDIRINVHGGLTYGQKFDSSTFFELIKNLKYFGDLSEENYKRFDGYWMIGFDTSHARDNLINCDFNYVVNEVASLLEQCLDDSIDGMENYKTIYSRKKKLNRLENL